VLWLASVQVGLGVVIICLIAWVLARVCAALTGTVRHSMT